jgi:hypothetical protein
MTCITLTRVAIPQIFGTPPIPGWEVAHEGQLVATYTEEKDGWLRQIGSSRFDALLRNRVGARAPAKAYRNLDDLREAYVLGARTWEERQVGGSAAWHQSSDP